MSKRFTSPLFLGCSLFFFALFLRILLLNYIPIGIEDDNLNFVLNAKSVFLTGSDISGTWNPLSLQTLPDEHPQSELTYLFLAPFIGLLPLSLFFSHLPYVVASALLSVILFLITRKLLNQHIGLIVGIVAAINPWGIFFGRSAFEAPLALFFYILSWYLILQLQGWKKLFAFIPLLFGFYTYMAYKLLLIPFVFAILLFSFLTTKQKEERKPLIVFGVLCILLFSFFVFSIKQQSTQSRLTELSFINTETVTKEVNMQRQLAIESPITPLFSNKLFASIPALTQKYLSAFTPSMLFSQTEATPRFMIRNHGYFYLLDLFFLLLGLGYLYTHHKKLLALCLVGIAIAPLPSVLSTIDQSYAMRSSLYFPFFFMLIGCGIYAFLSFLSRNKKIFIASSIGITGVYLFFLVQFLYIYLFINPVFLSQATLFQGRLLSKYLVETDQKIVVVTQQPKVYFKQYLFYTNAYKSRTDAINLQNNFKDKKYQLGNISFQTCKQISSLDKNTTFVFSPEEKCPLFTNQLDSLTIPLLADGGSVFSIVNDSICSPYTLKRYPSNLILSDFKVESLSEKKFCETFITHLE